MLRLPVICILCQQRISSNLKQAICTACYAYLPTLGPACLHCAQPLETAAYPFCGSCCRHKPVIAQVLTAYRFTEPLRTLIHAFKYQNALYLTTTIGQLMLHALPTPYHTECLIPVPLHIKRLRQRGYNQAALLAQYLATQIQQPCLLTVCEKTRHTLPQVDLDGNQRRTNLDKAFQAKPIHYRRVTIVDDLVTTGRTANELAKVLKQQGVEQIDLWCCAKAVSTPSETKIGNNKK